MTIEATTTIGVGCDQTFGVGVQEEITDVRLGDIRLTHDEDGALTRTSVQMSGISVNHFQLEATTVSNFRWSDGFLR